MKLKTLCLENFLSIRKAVTIDIDPRVTVLLGANDHGKSNILAAIEHSNSSSPITADEKNWDAGSDEEPFISYLFELTAEDCTSLAAVLASLPHPVTDDAAEEDLTTELTDPSLSSVILAFKAAAAGQAPTLQFIRKGVGGQLTLGMFPIEELPEGIVIWLDTHRPRVEIFDASAGSLQDAATAQQIQTKEFEFLQGIFYYAGLDPLDCAELFTQTDETDRRLDEASKILDAELKKVWLQGRALGLRFELRHRGSSIVLFADDPSVKARKTRMSKRSTGVTQFFRISMVLHAREQKHPANSYFYLFDEPGIFLHPHGQKDLMQVFERLSMQNQVLYTTHSLFMLNHNFPERHRLIVRDHHGTKADQKPYRSNWRLATDALGVYVTSGVMFNKHILLVEGDSDPIYIFELFRYLNGTGKIDADANMLGIFSFSNSLPNLRYMLQALTVQADDIKVLVLVDGDKEGKAIGKNIKKLCERLDVPIECLAPGKSIEDYALATDHFLAAAIETIDNAARAESEAPAPTVAKKVQESWQEHLKEGKLSTGTWFKKISKTCIGSEASKVGLARSYVVTSRGNSTPMVDDTRVSQADEVCRVIISHLKLPSLRADAIFEEVD